MQGVRCLCRVIAINPNKKNNFLNSNVGTKFVDSSPNRLFILFILLCEIV